MTAAKSAATWEKRVARWDASGMSCREYAAQIGVNPSTLAGRRWKRRRQATASSAVQREFTESEAADGPGFVDVTRQLAAVLASEGGLIELEVAARWGDCAARSTRGRCRECSGCWGAGAEFCWVMKVEPGTRHVPRDRGLTALCHANFG